VQQGRGFQLGASVVVLALMVIGFGWLFLRPPAPDIMPPQPPDVNAAIAKGAVGANTAAPADANTPEGQANPENGGLSADEQSTLAIVRDVVAARADTTALGVAIALGAALSLAVIWLGIGLFYLALVVVAAGAVKLGPVLHIGEGYIAVAVGVMILTAVFIALMQLAKLLTSYSLWMLVFAVVALGVGVGVGLGVSAALPGGSAGPAGVLAGFVAFAAAFVPLVRFTMTMQPGAVSAIAKNTLAEAVRLRLSVVFLVLLILGLAALPQLLDANEFLRYRVQSFLQYGIGGTFWLIGLLVVLFAVASVAFDQRDKTIWQTMTKPVSAAQYVLGKWLGVSLLAAVLLAVCGSGVYLFTEYLRNQPATHEVRAYVAEEGRLISDDRMILETQVLSARDTVQIEPWQIDETKFKDSLNARVESILQDGAVPGETAASRDARRSQVTSRIEGDLRKAVQQSQRVIGPGASVVYRFDGLQAAKTSNRPLVLRYKVNAGSNMPDVLYRVTFQFRGAPAEVREVPLAQMLTMPLLPNIVDDDGTVEVQITNGDVFRGGREAFNPESMSFPPDGLEITYAAGSFRMNFLRVMVILWVKLAFLAMVGVVAGTFLSFPVACLVSLTVFFAAEGASFTQSALDNYQTEDREGKTLILNTIVSNVAEIVSRTFKVYSDLRPTSRLVEGLRLSWSDAATGMVVLLLSTVVLYAIGVYVMKRRELAIYSGQ
jgi:ABC-type transport system involved in multi-copper enzyme maturation permease subunit